MGGGDSLESIRITALALGAAVLYGILHDQVSVRVSLEYLTIGHPRIVETSSPTLIALAWGIVATWWVGLPLGALLAACARARGTDRSKLGARDLLRPLAFLLAAMAAGSVTAGFAGHAAAGEGVVFLLEPMASRVPPDRHAVFIAALWAHMAAYAVGILGGLGVCAWVIRRRRQANSRGVSAGAARRGPAAPA
jgi:hypothetical protein